MDCKYCGYKFQTKKELLQNTADISSKDGLFHDLWYLFTRDVKEFHLMKIKCPSCGKEFETERFDTDNIGIALGVAFTISMIIDVIIALVLFKKFQEVPLYSIGVIAIISILSFPFLIFIIYKLLDKKKIL